MAKKLQYKTDCHTHLAKRLVTFLNILREMDDEMESEELAEYFFNEVVYDHIEMAYISASDLTWTISRLLEQCRTDIKYGVTTPTHQVVVRQGTNEELFIMRGTEHELIEMINRLIPADKLSALIKYGVNLDE